MQRNACTVKGRDGQEGVAAVFCSGHLYSEPLNIGLAKNERQGHW